MTARQLPRRRPREPGDQLDAAGFHNLATLGTRPGPAQHGADARQQLVGTERLGQVVVRAGVQPGDPVGLGGAGGEHDDRDLALPPQQAEQLEAVQTGHHDVEQDQVVTAPQSPGQAAPAVVCNLQVHAAAGEELCISSQSSTSSSTSRIEILARAVPPLNSGWLSWSGFTGKARASNYPCRGVILGFILPDAFARPSYRLADQGGSLGVV